MSRHEAIATITARLVEADDETVQAVAQVVQSLSDGQLRRPLSDRERALLEQSREDFKAGRTFAMDGFMARADALIARHRGTKGS